MVKSKLEKWGLVATILVGIVCAMLPVISLIMIWLSYTGIITFGEGITAVINHRIYIFCAIGIASVSQLLIGVSWKQRIGTSVVTFILLTLLFFIFGGGIAVASASESEPLTFNSMWVAFDGLRANADLTVGVNVKLIADSICYLIPSVVLLVLIFQMIYAGEADEFIKAFLEGIAVVIFMIIYSLVGGVPVNL